MKNTDHQIDHAVYQRWVKTVSIASLQYIIRDCQEAIAANPDNPKNSKYADEIAYCGMEIKRRKNA
jgi:hypothetical protein